MEARSRRVLILLAAALCGTAVPARAQYQFSIDRRGPTNTMPDSITGTCITPGDILYPPVALWLFVLVNRREWATEPES